jgi:hypothetical protein
MNAFVIVLALLATADTAPLAWIGWALAGWRR